MKYLMTKYEDPKPDDPVRIREAWRESATLKNIWSGYMVAVIGFPAKQIEWCWARVSFGYVDRAKWLADGWMMYRRRL
jgi:hypothetical protein